MNAGKSNIVIVPTSASDSDVLAEIHKNCFEKYWKISEFDDLLNRSANSGYLLKIDNIPAALILVMDTGDALEILTIATHSDFRRKGLATRLLQEFDSVSPQSIDKNWLLEVEADNASAISFYEGLGFTKVGVRKKYYKKQNNERIDAIIYSAKIGSLQI